MSQVSSTRKLLSASAVMASGTLISRVLGMVRVMLISFILGNGTRQVDILSIATMVPNALYILFAGGALNTVLVPQIVRAIKHDEDGGEAYINRIMTAFMLIVGVVAVVMTLAAPLITMLYTDSAWRAPELQSQYASMVTLTYLTLPQIFFYGAFFLLSQVLNARDKFGPMMWAPIANNIISILVLSTYFVIWGNGGDKSVAFTQPQVLLLGIGSTVGIAAQSLVLMPFLKRVGFKLRPRFDLKGTGLRHTFSLTKWTLGFVFVNQLTLIVVQRLATTATATGAGAGSNVYANAHLLWILPHSLVTTSLATAMLSNASRLAADNNPTGVAQEMMKTARLALIFLVPSTAVFLALATPTANLLFGHGSGADDVLWVGRTLMGFAVGLIPFTVQFLCLRTYYALEDTRTPFLLQIGIASINALGAIVFVRIADSPSLVAPMLALSYSLAYLVGVFLSWSRLRRILPALRGDLLGMHIVRLVLSALPGALLAFGLQSWLVADSPVLWRDFLAVLVGGMMVLGSTIGMGKVLRIRELRRLSDLLRIRRGARARKDNAQALAQEASQPPADFDDDPPTIIRQHPIITDDDFAHEDFVHEVAPHDAFRRPATVDAGPVVVAADPAEVDPGEEEHAEAHADDPSGAGGWSVPTLTPREELALESPEDVTEIVPAREQVGEPGMVLGVRYELVRRLMLLPESETWLAHDQVLSRDVVAHLMPDEIPSAEALLGAAQRGAAATDSRFLRVLDVARFEDGVYVIAEHSAGRTLGELLEMEPLSAKETAYVAREVGDALSTMHAQGLFHERLDPEHILITRSGSVRIVGFGTAAVLEGAETERAWSQRELDDVIALGNIVRAAQTGQWSDDPFDEAPGYPLTHVWEGVASGALATLQALVGALPPDDGSAELEAKMGLASRVKSGRPRPVPAAPADDGGPATLVQPALPDDALGEGSEEDDDATMTAPPRAAKQPRTVLWVLVALAVLALIIGLVTVAVRSGGKGEQAAPATSASSSAQPSASASASPQQASLKIAKVTDFDPEADGGNGEENPKEVRNVIDGDDATAWTTMRYLRRPNMGGQKPGVGIVLDLGEQRQVDSVSVLLQGKGDTTVELRIPKGDNPSMRTVKQWDTVVEPKSAPAGKMDLRLERALQTRYLLVYVSSLPPVEGGFQAQIGEVTVQGS